MRSTLSNRLKSWLTQLESLSSPQAAGNLIPHEESSRALERRGAASTSPHSTTTPRCWWALPLGGAYWCFACPCAATPCLSPRGGRWRGNDWWKTNESD